MSYHLSKKILLSFLILYFSIGMFIQTIKSAFDAKLFIPFYSWFLFDKVPNKTAFIEIRVMTFGEKTFDPPLPFSKAKGIVSNPQSIQARLLTQKIGEAVIINNYTEAEKLRRSFEQAFFKKPTKYELVLITYDPLERWKTGKSEAKTIKIFNTEK